jgi:hypothetical protein
MADNTVETADVRDAVDSEAEALKKKKVHGSPTSCSRRMSQVATLAIDLLELTLVARRRS